MCTTIKSWEFLEECLLNHRKPLGSYRVLFISPYPFNFLSLRQFSTDKSTCCVQVPGYILTSKQGCRQVQTCEIPMACDAWNQIRFQSNLITDVYFKYQKLIGELMFLCVHTCPELPRMERIYNARCLLRYMWVRREAKITWCASKVNPLHLPILQLC